MKETAKNRMFRDVHKGNRFHTSIYDYCIISAAKAFLLFFCLFVLSDFSHAQTDQSNNRFTEGDANDGGTLSLGVPLGSYKGRGMDLPVSLNYSSEVWKIEHLGRVNTNVPGYSGWLVQSVTEAVYAKNSSAGWRSSLALPIIEFPKSSTKYDYQGKSYDYGGSGYRIREVYIHMPDGSTHNLRKNDQPSNSTGVDMTGTFYAVDGSRIRFDANGTADTGTIYMPDGTRYVINHPTSQIIDRHENTLSYNENTRIWTDTLNRQIENPLPANPIVGDIDYFLPGLAGVNGGSQKYTFKWKKLENVLTPDATGNPPARKVTGSSYLPNPYAVPNTQTNYPQTQSTEALFTSLPPYWYGENGPRVRTLVVGKEQSAGQLFNPVLLAEIVLPDGTSYKFTYNIYGEINKVIYPTNAYDEYEHANATVLQNPYDDDDPDGEGSGPYGLALRSLKTRKQSIDGTGSDMREWRYSVSQYLDGGGSTTIIAPDKTRTEILKYGPGPKTAAYTGPGGQTIVMVYPFGFRDARVGMPLYKKFYSSSLDGLGGEMLRKEIYQYEQTTVNYSVATRTYPLSRTPRLTRTTSIIFEGSGQALTQSNTFAYDLSSEFSTGIDQTLAATYNYVVVDNQIAQTGDLTQIPLGTLAKYSEISYLNSSTYQNVNILGLQTSLQVREGVAPYKVVSRKEMVFDEPDNVPPGKLGLPTSERVWDSTKGLDTDLSAYLTTRAKFDTYSNRTEGTDAMGNTAVTTYDPTYQAFPIKVTTPIPDPYPSQNPDGVPHGSQAVFETTITYDTSTPAPLGLPMETTDANGQITRMEYNDLLFRSTKVIAPNGHQTITEYGAGTTEATRYIKVRTQIDNEKWSEAVSKYDGIGRTYFSKKIDSQGNIATKTDYDIMGRVSRSSNPYKVDAADIAIETIYWTTPEYDDLSRTKKVISPDTDDVQIEYGLSISDVIGTTKTITDQAGKKRKGLTDALGNMVRVIEDPGPQELLTNYVFDTFGNLRKTTQVYGQTTQNRYFMYDSLGRVLRAKQPEQDVNSVLAMATPDPITGHNQWSVKYEYDDNSNITKTTDARNISIDGTYDRFNRLIFRNYSDPASPDVSFFYDGTGLGSVPSYSKGKPTKVTSSVSESRNTSFDSMGRLLASQQITDGQTYTFGYIYNLSGALIEETYPSGRIVKNTLNTDGELAQTQSKKNASYGFFTYADSFTYNAAGVVTKMQLGNGRWETAQYDPERLQLTQIGLGVTNNDQNLLKLDFKYETTGLSDNNGSMREQKITIPTVGSNLGFTAIQTYTYDGLNRIQSAAENINGNSTPSWKQTFSYDRFGNRRFDAINTTTLGSCSQKQCNPLINTSDNRLQKDQDLDTVIDYDYDANGALTKDATGQRFGYDAESHQKEFFSASNSSSTPDATYLYDGEGKRVKKVVGTEVTVFVYDGSGHLAAEYSTTVVPIAQAKVSYLTSDHLGSPRVVTDQDGSVLSRKDFAAFGDEIITPQRIGGMTGNGYDPPNIRQDYTGYQKDGESGLEYAQARYYNSQHGRFTSVDPLTASATIRNPQTLNRYSYVTNSPYKFVDPLGLALADIGIVQTTNGFEAQQAEQHARVAWKETINAQYKAAHPELFPPASNESGNSQVEADSPETNSSAVDDNGGTSETNEPLSLGGVEVFVVSNVDQLEENARPGTWGYQEPGSRIFQCARLPLAWQNEQEGWGQYYNRGNRLSENWIMGDAVTDGLALAKGTVLATFDRNTGRYAQTNAADGGNNHTVVFLNFATQGGVKGMRVVEQRAGPAAIAFIPFNSRNNYANDAGKFSVVKINTRSFSPNFIDNNTRRTVMR